MSERRLEDTEDGVLVRRALSRFGVSILATMAVLLVAAYVVGGRLAQHQALRDARIQASALSDNLVAPLVDSDVRAHLPGAAASLDRELARRVRHGDIRHVKVWTAQGEVLWSDETQLIGRTFELPADVRETVRTGRPVAEVSELSRAENAHEKDEGRLLEVYTASRGVDGRPVLFEAYFDTERL